MASTPLPSPPPVSLRRSGRNPSPAINRDHVSSRSVPRVVATDASRQLEISSSTVNAPCQVVQLRMSDRKLVRPRLDNSFYRATQCRRGICRRVCAYLSVCLSATPGIVSKRVNLGSLDQANNAARSLGDSSFQVPKISAKFECVCAMRLSCTAFELERAFVESRLFRPIRPTFLAPVGHGNVT